MMYKYFEISEENLSYLQEYKLKTGIKSDKAILNKIIEEHRAVQTQESDSEQIASIIMNKFAEAYNQLFTRLLVSMSKTEEEVKILADVANTFLVKEDINNCILTDVMVSPVIQRSRNYHKFKISKSKQKKDNAAKK